MLPTRVRTVACSRTLLAKSSLLSATPLLVLSRRAAENGTLSAAARNTEVPSTVAEVELGPSSFDAPTNPQIPLDCCKIAAASRLHVQLRSKRERAEDSTLLDALIFTTDVKL